MAISIVRKMLWVGGIVAILVLMTQPRLRPHAIMFLRAPVDLYLADRTGIDMMLIEENVRQYQQMNGRYPSEPYVETFMRSMHGAQQPDARREPMRDPWGNPYNYLHHMNPEGYEIVSLGPDGRLRTRDDIVIRCIERPSPPAEAGMARQAQ